MKLKLYVKSACFALIVLMLLFGVRYVFKESSMHLQKVAIVTKGELDYISKPQIVNLIKPFQQDTWWELDVDDVTDAIKQYPGIKEIKVQKQWPDQLIVELTEYQPKAYWNSLNEILLEDKEVIAPKYFSGSVNLPVFYSTKDNIDTIENGYEHLQKIALGNGFSIRDISFQGNQWQVTLNTDVKVSLGSNRIEQKLLQLLQNYKNIEIPKGQKLASVDMRYHSGFAVGFKAADDGAQKG
ncbi:cell division protein FtsQ/DivIB [Cysteiniphilum halobium]|uniref:cell division protein FtsQ/DivIB n=1 Tax=Cysteiniphilum halobium TaxID=2219059 RepID=UPI000E65577E|nr:FtsQ-type POTRA domain-containing protein [Cysteiniphilum halobium]